MRSSVILALSGALAALAVPAAAQETYIPEEQQRRFYEAAQKSSAAEVTGVVNLFSNVLIYKYPKNFVAVYQAKQPTAFMLEHIPFGEDVRKNWSEMLTVQAFPKQAVGATSARDFALGLARRVGSTCPRSAIFSDLGAVAIKGALAHRVIFGCRNSSAVGGNEVGEMTIAQSVKRNGDIILVQFAHRGAAPDQGNPLIDSASQKYLVSLLDKLEITDNPNSN